MKFSRTLAFLLPLTIVALCRATAQSGDIRLSQAEPVSYQVPGDVQIQSAASIGGHTLVVWGTTSNTSDSTIRRELHVQLLRDTVQIGVQGALHGDAAVPSGFVQVIPLSDRYLVLWNDHRESAPGVYMRLVDTSGGLIGEEERFSAGQVVVDSSFGILTYGEGSGGRLIVWRSRVGTSGLYARSIDGHGVARGPEERFGLELSSVSYLEALPGTTLLTVDGDHYLCVQPDGILSSRRIPDRLLTEPYYLNADLSLDVIRGTELLHYGSLYDSTVSSRLELTFLRDSMLQAPRILERDTSGKLLVIYSPPWPIPSFAYPSPDIYQPVIFYSATVDSAGVIGSPHEYVRFVLGGFSPSYSGSIISYRGFDFYRICSSHYLTIQVDRESWYHGGYVGTSRDGLNFEIAKGGGITSMWYAIPYVPCAGVIPVIVSRVKSDTFSIVRVNTGTRNVDLSALTAHLGYHISERSPTIFTRGDSLCLVWSGRDPYELHRWTPEVNDQSGLLGSMPDETYSPSMYGGSKLLSYSRSSTRYLGAGFCAITTLDDRVDDNILSPTTHFTIFSRWYAVWLATSKGWQRVAMAGWSGYDPDSAISPDPIRFDPDRREMIVSYRTGRGLDSRTVSAFDSVGNRIWSMDSTNANMRALPALNFIAAGSGALLVIAGNRGDLLQNNQIVRTFSLAPAASGAIYQRLLGPSFLRYYFVDATNTQLRLEQFGFDGSVVNAGQVTFPLPAGNPSVIQDPRDSTILVLYEADGAHIARISGDLKSIRSDLAVSAARAGVHSPSAVLRDDTLFCVWEDYREGGATIYGNYLPIPRLAATTGTTPPAVSVELSTHPNPVRDRLDLEFSLLYPEPVDLTICNGEGRVVIQRRLEYAAGGHVRQSLDLSSLPAGYYLLHVRSGGLDARRALVVLH
jgi:hypothetical protein